MDENLKKLEGLLDLLNDGKVSSSEMEEVIQALLLTFKARFEGVDRDVENAQEDILSIRRDIRELESIQDRGSQDFKEALGKLRADLIARISNIELIPGEKGEKGDKGDQGEKGEPGDVKELAPEEIRDSLELLSGDDRLKREAIAGLDDYEEVCRMAREPKVMHMGGGNVEVYNSTGKVGSSQRIRFTGATVTNDTDGAVKVAITGGGASTWGSITGTLSDQTDLQSALDGKANALGADDNYVTDAEKVKLSNLSGTNTGDQDLSGLVPKTTTLTINGTSYDLSQNRSWTIAGEGSAGITRSINSISADTTAGSTALTDYVYLVSGTTTLTLPTAVGNTNRYTVKNSGAGAVTVATTSSQTIDGGATAIIAPEDSIDLISNNSNWYVV